jgi:uncharacterized protein YbaR (Trm112 family)/SAM-dependent methyltransferase
MLETLLEILRCPFCGCPLSPERGESLELRGEEIVNGIIFCQCSAYPIVAGIPVFTTERPAPKAREHLAAGEYEQALFTMLGLEAEERQAVFRRFVEKATNASFREGVEILCLDAEGAYFVYRFSDPTYLASQTLLRALGGDRRCFARRAIDICGGSGHLTRVLCQMAGGVETLLADAHFWKLWLAKRFIAPACQPVCCDANHPLPFARDAFSLAVCSDAFHYVWSKRLLADELARAVGQSGVIALPHLHNSLVENFSAGMPLPPEGWRNLFAELNPRVFKESDLFESALRRRPVGLSRDYSDEELRDEAALFLIATKLDGVYRVYERSDTPAVTGVLSVNPLYEVARKEGRVVMRLQFPSPDYEEEFGACKRYLPERVEINADALNDPLASSNSGLRRLIESRVLLDLPERY